jgi:hypothetical protein
MGFGVTSGISKSTNHSVQVAEKIGHDGAIEHMTSYGQKCEITEEFYSSSFTNAATNAQTGASIISAHSLTEANTDYAKESKTTITIPATT